MILIIIYNILSFLLDGLIANYIPELSYFKTIYTITSLIISYLFFDNDSKYFKILLIFAILFDLIYTNTLVLNVFIFTIIYYIIKNINLYIPNNIFTVNLKTFLGITIYHLLSFLILSLANFDNYTFSKLFNILLSSIPMTIVYTTISYLIIKKLYYKKYPKKIK